MENQQTGPWKKCKPLCSNKVLNFAFNTYAYMFLFSLKKSQRLWSSMFLFFRALRPLVLIWPCFDSFYIKKKSASFFNSLVYNYFWELISKDTFYWVLFSFLYHCVHYRTSFLTKTTECLINWNQKFRIKKYHNNTTQAADKLCYFESPI